MTDGRLTKDRINLLITNLFGGGIDSVSSHILNTYVYRLFTFTCIQLHAYTQFHLWIQLLHSIYACIYTCTINCQHVCYCLHLGIPASECISYWRDNVHLWTFSISHKKWKRSMQFIVCWHILQRHEIMFGKSARSRAMSILLEKGLIILFGHKSCGFLTNNTKNCHKWVTLGKHSNKMRICDVILQYFF